MMNSKNEMIIITNVICKIYQLIQIYLYKNYQYLDKCFSQYLYMIITNYLITNYSMKMSLFYSLVIQVPFLKPLIKLIRDIL